MSQTIIGQIVNLDSKWRRGRERERGSERERERENFRTLEPTCVHVTRETPASEQWCMEHSKHIHIHSQTQPQPYTHLRHIYRSKCQACFSRVPPCCFCLCLPVHPLQTQSLGFGFSIFLMAFASTSVLFASVCPNSSSVSKIKFCLRITYFHIISFHILSEVLWFALKHY